MFDRETFEIDKSLGLHSGNSGHAPVVCSWCDTYIGPSPKKGFSDGDITHGICEQCTEQIRKDMNLVKDLGLDVAVSP